jgi:hypothetical protein
VTNGGEEAVEEEGEEAVFMGRGASIIQLTLKMEVVDAP